jgi:putative ABC transport system permease protein
MKIIKYLNIASKALIQNKVRTSLTLIGIVIGIASVIAIFAISQGATKSVTGELGSLGTKTISVSPGKSSGRGDGPETPSNTNLTLKKELYEVIENKLPANLYDSKYASFSSSFDISYRNKVASGTVVGVGSQYPLAANDKLVAGRSLSQKDILIGNKVAVIPENLQKDLFGSRSSLGQNITIKGIDLTVAGVVKSSGFGGGQATIPLGVMQNNLSTSQDFSSITVISIDGKQSLLETTLKKILLKYYNLDDDTNANFTISNSQSIIDSANKVTALFTLALTAIAGLSLLVGSIGIMNIMLVTVSERTKEIGLRKALGAKVSDILSQFLTEAVLVTLVGGIIGVIVGWVASVLATTLSKGQIQAEITPVSVLIACGISCSIGIIFGFYPAWKASRLQPIDALRYE